MLRIPMDMTVVLCAVALGAGAASADDRSGLYEDAGSAIVPAGYHGALSDSSERYASGVERWCLGIKDCIRDTRLRGYKRMQKHHRDLLYPECPPYCSPTHGYHTTRWRRYPEYYEYCPGEVIYAPSAGAPPMMLPLTPTPEYAPPAAAPEPAPPAPELYYPESGPIIQPADPGPAPAAPAADPTAPPAPPEPELDAAGETFLPARPMDGAVGLTTAFEEPGLLPID